MSVLDTDGIDEFCSSLLLSLAIMAHSAAAYLTHPDGLDDLENSCNKQ